MRIAVAQAHPVWLDPAATTQKMLGLIEQAADDGVRMLAFPETFLPGYPFWVMLGGLERFNEARTNAAYAAYTGAAVVADGPEIRHLVKASKDAGVFLYVGAAERAGTSVHASLFAIHPRHGVVGVHRKLMPTYGERTVWAPGDGHGLHAYDVDGMLVGGLNCWENWMPLARHALYAAGEEIHVAAWPGSAAMAVDIARFIALEGRVWVALSSGLLSAEDVSQDFPFYDLMVEKPPGFYNGGSCIVAPDGSFAVEPVVDDERILATDVDPESVRRARQTFDPTGHYARPDVFDVHVNRRRLTAASFDDSVRGNGP